MAEHGKLSLYEKLDLVIEQNKQILAGLERLDSVVENQKRIHRAVCDITENQEAIASGIAKSAANNSFKIETKIHRVCGGEYGVLSSVGRK